MMSPRRWNLKRCFFWSGLAAALSVAGCSALTSQQITEGTSAPVKGVAYCLPMGKVTVQVLRKPGTSVETTVPAPNGPPNPNALPTTTVTRTPSSYRITYKETVYVPDPTKRFAVRYSPNAIAEDDIHIQVDKHSLLTLVDVTVEDQTVEAAKKLIQIGANVFKIAARGFSEPLATEEIIFTGTFDPTSGESLGQVNGLLRRVEGGPYTVGVLSRSSPDYKAAHSTYRSADSGKREFSGVAFRPALAYDLILSARNRPQEMDTVLLPNEAEILYMPVTRSVFVKKVETLNFDAGMLVEAKIKKPSEIVAGLEIPLEITRTILALPGDIVADNLAGLKQRDEVNKQKLATIQSQGALERGKIDDDILTREVRTKQLQDPSTGSTPGPSPAN